MGQLGTQSLGGQDTRSVLLPNTPPHLTPDPFVYSTSTLHSLAYVIQVAPQEANVDGHLQPGTERTGQGLPGMIQWELFIHFTKQRPSGWHFCIAGKQRISQQYVLIYQTFKHP